MVDEKPSLASLLLFGSTCGGLDGLNAIGMLMNLVPIAKWFGKSLYTPLDIQAQMI